jgi:6-pyruvoyltetrahydropterin/6-carboxytetrahydropterin synthase
VKGEPDPDDKMIINLKILKKIIQVQIIGKFDHHFLNEINLLKNKIPTLETLAIIIWKKIEPKLPPHVTMHRIKLYDSPNDYVEFFGEF